MRTAVRAERVLRVEPCMGTVFTIDMRDSGDWSAIIDHAVAWLHRADAVFSTYRPDSDISRINRGEVRLADADPMVAEVLALCADLQQETGGYFLARRGSAIDPTGLVKGWAVERISDLLRGAGSANHAVNGGGDLQLAGEQRPGEPWRVGISDPRGTDGLLGVVTGSDFAVATSGTAQRGAHLIDPFTGGAAGELLSVSMTGPRLTRVDAYATAAFGMGRDAMRWVAGLPAHEALIVDTDGKLWRSPAWPAG